MSKKIREARLRAGLTQADVGGAFQRTAAWEGMIERGETPISSELEGRILVAIRRLSALRESVRDSKEQLVEDLRLPTGTSIR